MNFEEENAHAAQLVRRAAAGDRGAEAELVSVFDGRVLVKLRQASKSFDRISDMRQEVWLRAIEAIRNGRVAQPERFCGFLFGVAQNIAREQGKHDKRPFVALDIAATLKYNGTSVEDLLDRAFLSRHVQGCLTSMNDRDRELVYRHYIREDPKEETCRQLDLTAVHYSRVLHRARKRLASLLGSSLGRADLEPDPVPAANSVEPGCDRSGGATTDSDQD